MRRTGLNWRGETNRLARGTVADEGDSDVEGVLDEIGAICGKRRPGDDALKVAEGFTVDSTAGINVLDSNSAT